jgi:hypothetical protein
VKSSSFSRILLGRTTNYTKQLLTAQNEKQCNATKKDWGNVRVKAAFPAARNLE